MSKTTPLNTRLYKSFKLSDELLIAEFDFGLTKSKLLLSQRYIAAYNKLQSSKDILFRYEQLEAVHIDHNKLTVSFEYKLELSDLSALDESTYKLKSIDALQAVLFICQRMHQRVPHERDLVVTVEKSAKELKKQGSVDAESDVKQSSTNNVGAKIGKKSFPVLYVHKGELVERELIFQKSEMTLKLTDGQAKNEKNPDKYQITIPYTNLKQCTIESRPFGFRIEDSSKKKVEVEIWSDEYLEVLKKVFENGEVTVAYAEHALIWAKKDEISNLQQSAASSISKKLPIGPPPPKNKKVDSMTKSPDTIPQSSSFREKAEGLGSLQMFNPLTRTSVSDTRTSLSDTRSSLSETRTSVSETTGPTVTAKNVLKTTVIETNQLNEDGKLLMAKKPGSAPKGRKGKQQKKRPPTKKNIDIPIDSQTGIEAPKDIPIKSSPVKTDSFRKSVTTPDDSKKSSFRSSLVADEKKVITRSSVSEETKRDSMRSSISTNPDTDVSTDNALPQEEEETLTEEATEESLPKRDLSKKAPPPPPPSQPRTSDASVTDVEAPAPSS